MDVQPEKAQHYVERAGTTFPTVVDGDNLLGGLLGFKAIPNGVLLDEEGVIRYAKYGGFDIRGAEHANILERWAAGGPLHDPADAGTADATHQEAIRHFRQGVARRAAGDLAGALALWRKGVELEPDNFVIRKQIWAIEHPERFYDGAVDYAWQREQLDKGQ